MIDLSTIAPATPLIVTGDTAEYGHDVPAGTVVIFAQQKPMGAAVVNQTLDNGFTLERWVHSDDLILLKGDALQKTLQDQPDVKALQDANSANAILIQQLRDDLNNVRHEYSQFKDEFRAAVRESIAQSVKDGFLARDRATEMLEELNLPPLRPLRDVIVRESNGDEMFAFYEKDSELSDDELIEEVRESITVDATILKVRFDVACSFDGDPDDRQVYWEGDECGGTSPEQDMIDDFIGNLEIVVGES
jgi:hypothetical protein